MPGKTKFIAFLRAINVGGHTVKMTRLRELFEELGLSNVETFIASGNVIFESAAKDVRALEKKIETHLRKALGYEVGTFIRSAAELEEVAQHQPFSKSEMEREGHSLYIGFVGASPDEEVRKKLMTYRSDLDDLHLNGREVYWLCRARMSESAFSGALTEKTLCMAATFRNVTTVRKLAAKCRPDSERR
jgi:uncharacterized protein (DUF1697 family)